jgi:transglutaminase-like putative cysteine protease
MDETRYLRPGKFIDSATPGVVAFAREVSAPGRDDRERIILLYKEIRDRLVYDPYVDFLDPANYRASSVLAAGRGFCVGKAALLCACARAVGVPARVGYADVRNHLTSPRLHALFQTDLFVWHSYADLLLDARWVKATPAFNGALCERLGLHPLEFDGTCDSLFHPFDRAGRRHMEYVVDRGTFPDVPFDTIVADFLLHYPALRMRQALEGDFQEEAVGEPIG